jgi:hypothetical protein
MEGEMLDQTTVRRRKDGSIDIDFYRQSGLAERRAVMKRAIGSVGKHGRPFAALMVAAAGLTAAFAGTGSGGPAPM